VGSGHDVTLVKWSAPFITALIALAVLAVVMTQVPLRNAGDPDEPAPVNPPKTVLSRRPIPKSRIRKK